MFGLLKPFWVLKSAMHGDRKAGFAPQKRLNALSKLLGGFPGQFGPQQLGRENPLTFEHLGERSERLVLLAPQSLVRDHFAIRGDRICH
jgi:hypothetical protein